MGNLFVIYAEKLRALAAEHDLVRRALIGAETALDNCKLCETELAIVPLGGVEREKICARFVKHAFIFEYAGKDVPYVETNVELYTEEARSGRSLRPFTRPIGTYKLITSTEGADEDDFLILD